MNDTVAVSKAVAFAEDAAWDAYCDRPSLSPESLQEVLSARAQVRRVAASGMPHIRMHSPEWHKAVDAYRRVVDSLE